MPNENVRPGEIISSDLMNFVLSKLDELEETVNGLGLVNRVRIDEITPAAGALVDGFMTIIGANFLHPPGNNVVRIAGQLVTEFGSPSTSGILTCRVPSSIVITDPAGEEIIVHVENAEFGVTEASYRLFPASTQPPLSIASVLTINGSAVLNTGDLAIITGDNFSTDANLNDIRLLQAISDSETVEHVVSVKEVISTTPGDMQIRFTVPLIADLPPNIPRPMPLRLTFGEQTVDHQVSVRAT